MREVLKRLFSLISGNMFVFGESESFSNYGIPSLFLSEFTAGGPSSLHRIHDGLSGLNRGLIEREGERGTRGLGESSPSKRFLSLLSHLVSSGRVAKGDSFSLLPIQRRTMLGLESSFATSILQGRGKKQSLDGYLF